MGSSTQKLSVALVALIALVVGLRLGGVWGGHKRATPAAPAAKGSGSAEPVASAPAGAETPESARTIPTVHDDDPTGTLRLEGQVIDEHAAPVEGATVAIDSNPPRAVTTAADGAFVFDGLLRRDYAVEATKGEQYGGPARLRLVDKTEPVTLRMRRGGTLEVAVSERGSDTPVAGADVELRGTLTWTARTGVDGIARLVGIGATWSPLAVRATGFAPGAVMVQTTGQPEPTSRIAVALARGAAISGRVVDEGGKPLAGARVVATAASEPLPVVDPRRDGVLTGPDGGFTLPVVAAGTWRLTASHGERAPVTSVPLTVDGLHPRSDVELRLGGGVRVHGTVKDKAGNPVAGADVAVVADGFVAWRGRRQAFTDAAGAFTITGVPPRRYDVVAWHDEGASAIARIDLATGHDAEVALVLDITGSITGEVLDSQGRPIAEAEVIAEPVWSGGVADRTAWAVRGVQETVADQAGAFSFTGLPDGDYRVRAGRPGALETALSRGTMAKPSLVPLHLIVPDTIQALGKVAFADGKVPAAFTLTLGATNPVAFASKDGGFALAAIGGKHSLTVSGPGFVTITKDVELADDKDSDLGTITIQEGRSIAGRVVDAQGVAVARAFVAAGLLLTGGGADLYVKDESIGASDTYTDDDGRFVLGGFPPAPLTIVAGKPDVGRAASVRLPASPDSATVELVLAPTTKLTGTITKGGAPLPDTVVIANPIGAVASNFFVTTGPDGAFVLDALAPGPYVVYPMLGGGGNKPKDMYLRRVELAAGAQAQTTIDIAPGAIELAVSVKTDGGKPVPMAQLVAIEAAVSPATLDELRDGTHMPVGDTVLPVYIRGIVEGTATLQGLRPATHTLCAILGDPREPETAKFKCTQVTLTTAAAQTATLSVPAAWLAGK